MKNNILAIIVAAGTAVVGSSLFSAPAHAQLQVDQEVKVEIKVPEVLYLRTFDTVSLDITGDDLAGTQGVITNGVGKDKSDPAITTGATTINKTTPFDSVGSVTKTVNELYAVWSNNPDGGVEVTLSIPTANSTLTNTGTGGGTATIVKVDKTVDDLTTAPGLVNPHVGGAEIEFNLSNASAVGTYAGGIIKVQAVAP